MAIAENAAELACGKVENTVAICIHHVATFSTNDHTIHERLQQQKILAMVLP